MRIFDSLHFCQMNCESMNSSKQALYVAQATHTHSQRDTYTHAYPYTYTHACTCKHTCIKDSTTGKGKNIMMSTHITSTNELTGISGLALEMELFLGEFLLNNLFFPIGVSLVIHRLMNE